MKRLLCFLLFHRLRVIQEFGGSRKVQCIRCERYFGMHDGMQAFVPWDDELEEMYVSFGYGWNGRTLR